MHDKDDDACGLCRRLADLHCTLYGHQQPEFCDLRTQYLDGHLSGDELILRLADLATPAQAERVMAALSGADVDTGTP